MGDKKHFRVYVQRPGHGDGQGRRGRVADGAHNDDRTAAVQLQAEHLPGQHPD